MTEQRIGGPCTMCGVPQAARRYRCQKSWQQCPYGKFYEPLLHQDDEFAKALGCIAGTLARMEISINQLDARVRELEGRPQ